jgi:hypothetical protein
VSSPWSSSRCKVAILLFFAAIGFAPIVALIPSTLHQFLIQWIDDEIEVVHVDASAYIDLVDAMADW